MKAIEREGEIVNTIRMRQILLENNVRALMQEKCQLLRTCSEDIGSVKSELEAVDKDHIQGAIIRARAQKLLPGETPMKQALSVKKKKYACQNHINEIECNTRKTRTQK